MRTRRPPPPSDHAFARYAFRLYGRPGVARACLDLQDRAGADVNLVLLACWWGASGRGRLPVAAFARARRALAVWNRDVVHALRRVRRALKAGAGARPDARSRALRRRILAAELAAERIAQARIVAALAATTGGEPGAPAAAIGANLSVYCRSAGIALDPANRRALTAVARGAGLDAAAARRAFTAP
jgi:uncharacterized protein (TIGR02444 family)